MPQANFAKVLPLVLAHEGGYVNHPADPGGATNKGVTQAVYDAYRVSTGQKTRSVKSITAAEVSDIYQSRYWNLADCGQLPAGVDYAVFDYSVNSGVGKAIKDLQRTVNGFVNRVEALVPLKVDGINGQDTAAAVAKCCYIDEEGFINSYCDRRMSFLKSLKTWKTFGKGWQRRVDGDRPGVDEADKGVRDYAVLMARSDLAFPIPKKELPSAIGTKAGEAVPAKGFGSQVSVLKTAQGVGAALAGAGVTGQTVLSAAETTKAHVNGTLLGQIALIVFVLLMIGGVGLVLFKFFEDRKEKTGA